MNLNFNLKQLLRQQQQIMWIQQQKKITLKKDSKEDSEHETEGHQVLSLKNLSEAEDGDLDKMKKRAERFGTVLSPALSKSDEEQRISKRKERFGDVKANDANTKTSTFKYNKITMDSSTDAKKQKRAERFGLT
ncbi:hypothetical protein KUTeg_008773 [Tegillarca granosa]|uniref:THO1-MOS11 C-terminal domain-containing protein n=1 Tax=Tegillarca granosa TaxID=220873 RepID=A0ABQ9FA46_TEGGR|nr:hypothetical protein KUTeg_008773 [Tegillarca granosa]